MLKGLHVLLAIVTTGAVIAATLEGASRIIRNKPAGDAALAFALIPFADNPSISLPNNRTRGLYRVVGGLVCLIVLTRLFVTGQN